VKRAAALTPVPAVAAAVVVALAASLPAHLAAVAYAAPTDRKPLPNLVGRSVSSARHAAQDAGFTVPHTYDALGLGRNQIIGRNWKVCAQEPRSGKVERTAEITLGVVRQEETCPGTARGSGVPASRLLPDLSGKSLSAVYEKVGHLSSVHATDVSGRGRIVLLAAGWQVCSHHPAPGEVFAGRRVEVAVVRPPERCP
jgi:hypothetical protein